MEDIKEISNKLKLNPLLQMSLGSKELFHSNVWKWLIDVDSAMIKVFFDSIIDNFDHYQVKREYQHFDLSAWEGQNGYILENKIKSLFTEEQLVRYNEKISKKEKLKKNPWIVKQKILTGLEYHYPNFDFQILGYQFLDYLTIARRIRELLKISQKFSKFEKELVEQYCDFIEQLSQLFQYFFKTYESTWHFEDENLKQLRLNDIYGKLRFQDFEKKLQKLELLKSIGDFELKTDFGFSNGSPFVEFYYERDKENNYRIGIQIQGLQYRRFVRSLGKEIKNDENYQKYRNFGWLTQPGKNKDYCGYGKDFIYTYQKLNNDELSYESLQTKIKSDFEILQKIITDNLL